MADPIQTLREALISASDDHVYISQIRDPAFDALDQVEALVEAAREERKSRAFQLQHDRALETLDAALAPFKDNT